MSLPAPVTAALGDEEVAARVSLKGENALFVTRTRTLVYSGEGLLSDESVEEFPHDAERVEVSESRRKAKIRLDYGLDGERAFSVPPASLEEALHPVLAGVLNAGGVTEAGETVTRTYRFSELTLVVTSRRVVKHVGAAVWDDEYEEIRFEDVTGLDVEEGNVASQLVLDAAGRSQRIKVPTEQAREVRERVEEALLAYHDVATYEAFADLMADDEEPEPDPADAAAAATGFESDLDPIDLSDPDDESAGATPEAPAAPSTADAQAGGAATDESATDDGGQTVPAGGGTAAGETAGDATAAQADAVAPGAAAGNADAASGPEDPGESAETGSAETGSADAGTDATAGAADATTDDASAAGSADQGGAASGGTDDAGATDTTVGDAGSESDAAFEEFETAVAEPVDVSEELAALRRTVERQRDLLARQVELIEAIVAEFDENEK